MARVIAAPSKYIQGKGEIKKLAQYYRSLGEAGAFIVLDSYILAHHQKIVASSFIEASIPFALERFGGECSKREINRLIKELAAKGGDAVIGIGGGKTLDTAKAVGHYTNMPVIIVPTVASTDAPCSALAVIYTDEGTFDSYLYLKANPNIVLADTSVIAKAPARLLIAGMGDALATYFEARACMTSSAVTIAGGSPSKAAFALAKLCLDTLLKDGLKAKIAAENRTSSLALENVIEANTYLSGVGFESGGLAAAHAVHNGLTSLPETHSMYHGEKVAFGTIVQLVLENADLEEIKQIIHFCKSVGLPTTLKQIGIRRESEKKVMQAAKVCCRPEETVHNMPFEVHVEDVYNAILTADELGAEDTLITKSI